MELSEKQRNKLMEQIYGGYNRSPDNDVAIEPPGQSHKERRTDDYYTYGGEPRLITTSYARLKSNTTKEQTSLSERYSGI